MSAELIARLEHCADKVDRDLAQTLMREAAAALAAQAQEIERLSARGRANPLSDWHEDIGPVLWWRFPVQEPPYVGTPWDAGRAVEVTIRDSVRDYKYIENIGGWPGYHTHWTPLPDAPREPQS